jgi:hypothetical protein
MKNSICTWVFLFLAIGLCAQEGFKLGIQGGLPINDFNGEVSVAVGLNTGYMFALGEVVDLGVDVGYVHGFKETFSDSGLQDNLKSVQFVPLAVSTRIWPSNSFSFGGDVGYALGISDGNEGGIYYRPLISYLMGPQTELNLSYTGISLENKTWNTVTIGVVYTFLSARHYR